MDDATRWIETYRTQWEHRFDRLDAYIEREKGRQRRTHVSRHHRRTDDDKEERR
jgi:hypothetical protein